MSSGIYQIENQVNEKCYIGSAVNIRRRWTRHLSALRLGHHCNPHLQSAFDNYGKNAFAFSILENVEDVLQLIPREQYYLDMLKPEYNIAPIAGSHLGCRRSLETRRKISKAMTGERNPNYGKTGKQSPNYGKHHSDECRAKISAAQKGKHPSDETRAKISAGHVGHPISEETRKKISVAMSGERNPNFGKHSSDEARVKMIAAWTPERRQAQSKRMAVMNKRRAA